MRGSRRLRSTAEASGRACNLNLNLNRRADGLGVEVRGERTWRARVCGRQRRRRPWSRTGPGTSVRGNFLSGPGANKVTVRGGWPNFVRNAARRLFRHVCRAAAIWWVSMLTGCRVIRILTGTPHHGTAAEEIEEVSRS